MMRGVTKMRVLLLLNLVINGQIQICTTRRNDCEFPSSVKSVKSVTSVYDVRQFCSATEKEQKTPDNFEDIFRTRCKNHINECEMSKGKDCDELWKTFYQAFAYKKPCIDKKEYKPYCNEAKHEIPYGKTLFYSGDGPYDESHDVKIPYVTLEHTLTGNVLDRIGAWCGKLEDPGINYDECPDRNACHRPDPESNAKCAFWQQASTEFAKLATGDVQVLLDGAKEDGEKAFHSKSYFKLYELPNLNKDNVKTIHILVMYSTKNIIETCGTGSIKDLQSNISKTFKHGYTCKNFTGFDAVDEHSGRRAIDDTANCYFPCTASSVGLNFVMLLICALCAFVEINKQ